MTARIYTAEEARALLAATMLDDRRRPSGAHDDLRDAAPDLAATVEHLEARALAAEAAHREAVDIGLRMATAGEALGRDLDATRAELTATRAELTALRDVLARRVTDATRPGQPKHVLTPAGPGDRPARRRRAR